MTKKKNKTGLYKLDFGNGKYYIGVSTNYERRICIYRNLNCKDQPKLYNAIKHYGWENVKVTFIEYPEELLDANEIALIRAYDSIKNGYNILLGGRRGCGLKHSEESKKKISEALTGRKHTEEAKKRMSVVQKGRVVSDETRKKLSEIAKRRMMSEEHKKKISETLKKKVTPDKIEKMRKIGQARAGDKHHNWRGGAERLCPACGMDKVWVLKTGRVLAYCKKCSIQKRIKKRLDKSINM